MSSSHAVVCTECSLVRMVVRVSVTVVEMAHEPPEPYRMRNADESRCVKCNSGALYGMPGVQEGTYFNRNPERIAELERLIETVPEKVFIWWEKPEHSDRFPDHIGYLEEWISEHEKRQTEESA